MTPEEQAYLKHLRTCFEKRICPDCGEKYKEGDLIDLPYFGRRIEVISPTSPHFRCPFTVSLGSWETTDASSPHSLPETPQKAHELPLETDLSPSPLVDPASPLVDPASSFSLSSFVERCRGRASSNLELLMDLSGAQERDCGRSTSLVPETAKPVL